MQLKIGLQKWKQVVENDNLQTKEIRIIILKRITLGKKFKTKDNYMTIILEYEAFKQRPEFINISLFGTKLKTKLNIHTWKIRLD